jgi:dTDP-4-amino-4,6-dideoxygalactose transaminase
VGCFSFFPGKNLGAYGDAGAVVSQDEELIRRIRMLANHGRLDKYFHQIEGVNSRLDGLNAGVLRVKLRRLDAWNAARRRNAQQYIEMLKESEAVLPVVNQNAESVWHLFVLRVSERDEVWKQLNERGIGAGIHYPVPLHRQPAYQHLDMAAGTLPVTERTASSVVSVPMYPELSAEQIATVSRTLMETTDVYRPA